jgi:hypothetical protein
MMGQEIALAILLAVTYFVFLTCVAAWRFDDDLSDAFWWPIHLVKALLKSLYRALFTGWKL